MRLPFEVMGICYRRKGDSREYLMLLRRPEKGGFWQPVTGGFEEGETIDDCLLRELSEEIALTPKKVTPLLEVRQFYDKYKGTPWAITECMFGVELTQEMKITLSDEHSEYRWCTLNEAIGLMKYEGNKNSLRLLDDYLVGKKIQIPRIITELESETI